MTIWAWVKKYRHGGPQVEVFLSINHAYTWSFPIPAVSPSNFGLQQAPNGAAAAILRGRKQRRGAAVGGQGTIGAGF